MNLNNKLLFTGVGGGGGGMQWNDDDDNMNVSV